MEEDNSQQPTSYAWKMSKWKMSLDNINQDGETRDIEDELQKIGKDLNDLNVSGPGSINSSHEFPESSSSEWASSRITSPSSSMSSREFPESGKRSGPLPSFHRGTAIWMLKNYLTDLTSLNIALDDNLQKRTDEYQAFLKVLVEANQREQNSQLTEHEKIKVSSMLKDHQIVLLGALEYPEDVPSVDDAEFKVGNYTAEELPLYLYEANFSRSGYVESLFSALDLCETQVREFKQLLPSVRVYRHQCNYLVETLEPTAVNNFERCHRALGALQKVEADGGGVSSSSQHNCIHFCFVSLIGLSGKFQLVVDLFRKCASENLHKTALELSVLPPPPLMSRRWSEFSLAIQNCEWSMDLVELAFYTLEKFLAGGTHIFRDVSFKWSKEKCRMVLQIQSKLGRQDNRLEKSVFDVSRELEVKDLADLTEKLHCRGESANVSKWKLSGHLSKEDFHRANMANFLSNKLSGPIPHARYLPWTFRVESSSLKFKEYLESGSSGMVAKYTWCGENVAVKSVRSAGLNRNKFEEEAAVLAVVQHPNVVRLIGCGFLDKQKTGMLVMELMDHDLRTVIESRIQALGPGSSPFTTIVAIDIILQIALAMQHLKDHKVLHRDLKAKNILVNINSGGESSTSQMRRSDVSTILPYNHDNYVVKISDFGLAKCQPHSSWVRTRMAGATGWRAPEVFHVLDTELSQEYRWPADVYSFAMTCYEILTGNLPFADLPVTSIHENVMAGKRPGGLDELEIPDLLKELVKRCWATDPDARPTFDDIVKSLWECRVKAILPFFKRYVTSHSVSRPASTLNLNDTILQEAGKPNLIGDSLVIDLTRDLLGVSPTGYVVRTSCSGGQGLSQPCALKRIDIMDKKTPDLARLDNPHVVHLIDHWIEERDLFLVMELMDGDLAKLMARTKKARASPFSLHVAVDLMLQIAKGMLHLHEMGVSHPYLKCENVLYRAGNKTEAYQVGDVLVKLGGFGCSKPADVDFKNRDVLCFGLTCLEILTGDARSDMDERSDMVARSSIPGTTPAILKDCIVNCLGMQPTFSEVVMVLLEAKSHIMQTCKDEILFSSESSQTKIDQTKTDGGLEEIFAVHQLHPQLGDVSTSVRATLVFFHGFHKVPEEWRRTWMTRDNKLVWPQKWLPEDLGAGNIRVLSVSFDANSNVSSNYNRYEMGEYLVYSLILSPRWNLGEIEEAIFLVGHSFGGVLIKSLVTEVRYFVQNNIDQQEAMKCEQFLKSLAKVVFYSVPHAPTGLEFENYISECKNIVALQRSSFLQSLQEDTRFIADMNKLSADFESAVPEKVKVLAFLEGKPMSKKRVLVTEKSCEGQSRSWEWHKIDKDNHFEVCRPDSKNHAGYRILLDHLQQHMNTPCGLTSTAMDVCEQLKIGSTDSMNHEGPPTEDTSVFGNRHGNYLLKSPEASLVTLAKRPEATSSSSGITSVSHPDSPSTPSTLSRDQAPAENPDQERDRRRFESFDLTRDGPKSGSVIGNMIANRVTDQKGVTREYKRSTYAAGLPAEVGVRGYGILRKQFEEPRQQSTFSRNHSLVYYGVRFRPDLRKWTAEIRVAEWKAVDKKLWLGTFDTEQAAARAVDLARKLVKCTKKHPLNLPCRELDLYSTKIPSHVSLTDISNDSMFKDVAQFIKRECQEYAASFPPTTTTPVPTPGGPELTIIDFLAGVSMPEVPVVSMFKGPKVGMPEVPVVSMFKGPKVGMPEVPVVSMFKGPVVGVSEVPVVPRFEFPSVGMSHTGEARKKRKL